MNYFIYTSSHFTLYGRYEFNKLPSLPTCGFITQLVEHCTSIVEVMGSNPVEALIFFSGFFSGFFFPITSIGKLTAMIILHFDLPPQFTCELFHVYFKPACILLVSIVNLVTLCKRQAKLVIKSGKPWPRYIVTDGRKHDNFNTDKVCNSANPT